MTEPRYDKECLKYSVLGKGIARDLLACNLVLYEWTLLIKWKLGFTDIWLSYIGYYCSGSMFCAVGKFSQFNT